MINHCKYYCNRYVIIGINHSWSYIDVWRKPSWKCDQNTLGSRAPSCVLVTFPLRFLSDSNIWPGIINPLIEGFRHSDSVINPLGPIGCYFILPASSIPSHHIHFFWWKNIFIVPFDTFNDSFDLAIFCISMYIFNSIGIFVKLNLEYRGGA